LTFLIVVAVRISRGDLRRWTKTNGIDVVDENRAIVRASIRRIRVAGIASAFLGILAIPYALQRDTLADLTSWLLTATLFTVGLVIAELLTHRPRGMVASASLEARSVARYLPPAIMRASRAAGLAGMLLILAAPAVPAITLGSGSFPRLGVVLLVLFGAPATVLVTERVQRWIVERPQPVVSATLLATDEAMRARSIHILAGSALFLEVQFLSVGLWAVGVRRGWNVVAVVAGIIAIAGIIASVRVSNRRLQATRSMAVAA
jgi:hypothetical protein